ncbi:MAG: HAD family hydrolase [Desulfobacula sp.]|jgi:phosphoglycolate phosphatase
MPETPIFDLILFDLEGTLVDFQWRLDEAVGEILPVLAASGIDTGKYSASPSYAELFNTTRDLTRNWNPQHAVRLFEHLGEIYDKYDKDALSRWTPYPDTLTLLESLAKAGYRMGVVSNCGAHAAGSVLSRFNLSGYFEIILSRSDVAYIKPSPEGLILALEKLGTSPDRALFIGDSINDILAARNVPMPSCFLSGGESRVTGEDGSIATFQISSLSDLAHILIY